MPRRTRLFRGRTLWLGFIAVLVPLLVLLWLQYGWLTNLEETSAVARTATLSNYLEAVATEIEYFYKSSAERALNIPSALFIQDQLEKVAYHCKKKSIKGARQIFVYDFEYEGGKPRLLVHDAVHCEMVEPTEKDEVRAITVACAPWMMLARKGAPLEAVALTIDERDPRNRIVLIPITDEEWRIVGLAGMVIDEKFFRKTLVPKTIEKYLPKFFPRDSMDEFVITVRDDKGKPVFSPSLAKMPADEVSRPFSFVFTDWRIGIRSRHLTPEQWARTNFAVNLTLSALLAIALVGGLVLALRAAARAMKLSEMKTDFVSNVSHELRTPLASIRVFGEFLRLGRVRSEEKTKEYGEYIETESRRLTQLINNILDFSKIESGRKTYLLELADVKEVLSDTLKTFEIRLRHTGFDIDFSAPPEPVPAQIDPEAIAQAFGNLMDNAVKYSGDSRRIAVRLEQRDGFVSISVTDHGIGISKEEQKKIFERFHRVSTGLVHDIKGSGLGLSIVSHIVDAHRGRITVESEPGKGSRFTIHIPSDPDIDAATDLSSDEALSGETGA